MITRILAALVGLAIVVPALVWGGEIAVQLVVGLVLILSLDEYARMAFPTDRAAALGWLVPTSLVAYLSAVYLPARWIGLVAVLLVVATMGWVVLRPGPDLAAAADRVGRYLVGLGWIAGCLSFLPLVRALDHGLAWLFLLLACAWLGDTGGYFAGRLLGRHRLYPRISPKKTWEGLAGGLVLVVAGALVVRWAGLAHLPAWQVAVAAAALGAIATLGDLAESLLKRAHSVKDSGRLMPGHGGLLDRIDSVLFLAPLVYALAVVLEG